MVAWVFVFLAGGYDTGFFWLHYETAGEWEMNPLALLAGPAVVIAVKIVGLMFAALIALYCLTLRPRLCWLLTLVVVLAYLLTTVLYLLP